MAEQCRRLIQQSDESAPSLPKALQPKHLLWMCDQIEKHAEGGPATKLHRWIGFVQAAMLANRMLDLDGLKAMFDQAQAADTQRCEESEDLTDHQQVLSSLPTDLENIVCETLRLSYIEFKGIGTNLACRSGVSPDARNMAELSALAESIEAKFGLPIEIVSGGNSANLLWAFSGAQTGRINNLRWGESLLLGREPLYRRPIDGLDTDAITLIAEGIESKVKPTQPWGEIGQTAFGAKPRALDRGNISQSILAIGIPRHGSRWTYSHVNLMQVTVKVYSKNPPRKNTTGVLTNVVDPRYPKRGIFVTNTRDFAGKEGVASIWDARFDDSGNQRGYFDVPVERIGYSPEMPPIDSGLNLTVLRSVKDLYRSDADRIRMGAEFASKAAPPGTVVYGLTYSLPPSRSRGWVGTVSSAGPAWVTVDYKQGDYRLKPMDYTRESCDIYGLGRSEERKRPYRRD